jgi:hypothetical protein
MDSNMIYDLVTSIVVVLLGSMIGLALWRWYENRK